uniref:Uncharacterized protein n=1 Tax=Arundo donax TaxID=35708 RepID=A0A0A9H521_ARUDO
MFNDAALDFKPQSRQYCYLKSTEIYPLNQAFNPLQFSWIRNIEYATSQTGAVSSYVNVLNKE